MKTYPVIKSILNHISIIEDHDDFVSCIIALIILETGLSSYKLSRLKDLVIHKPSMKYELIDESDTHYRLSRFLSGTLARYQAIYISTDAIASPAVHADKINLLARYSKGLTETVLRAEWVKIASMAGVPDAVIASTTDMPALQLVHHMRTRSSHLQRQMISEHLSSML